MSKHDEIRQLFSDFEATRFRCPNKEECQVRKGKEASVPPFLGYENTHVMVVAEAPSTSRGVGPRTIQLFSEVTISNKSPLHMLREFVREHYRTIPHFTDLAKCGVVGKYRANEVVLNKRVDICTRHFLLKEMDILKPKIVICVGNRSYEFFKRLKEEQGIKKSVELVFLTHYSSQAQLPLTIEDKYRIVWKWQAGFLSKKDIARLLPELSYFRKRPFSAAS